MTKKIQVVMLPSEDVDNYSISIGYGVMHTRNKKITITNPSYKPYHLYFISDEEIKEGDWVLNVNTNSIARYTGHGSMDWWKKIIATTDSSLLIQGTYSCTTCDYDKPLPQPSQDFLGVFVKEYNKGNVIEWVDVKYERVYEDHLEGTEFVLRPCGYRLKTNSKNEISIEKERELFN